MATRPTPPTKPGLTKLSDIARHVVAPKGIVSTGWPAVRDTCLQLKITFDPWQDAAGRAILGKRKDHLYAADAVVLSIPRQVGKTFLIGSIIFALCIVAPGTLAIWTAHRFKTAQETFDSMRAMALRKEMSPHVEKITTGAGDEAIYFRNGSRILFGARERGFGRGFAKVDVLVFDEAQILSTNAVDDMLPTTNQASNPLILYMGTPPKPGDNGEVFTHLRDEALTGDSDGTLYIEFSADEDADPTDRKQWAKANPSFPHRTGVRAIQRMMKHLTIDSFMREGLGLWGAAALLDVIDPDEWEAHGDSGSQVLDPVAVALDVAPMSRTASIAVAGEREDGRRHVEVVKNAKRTDWVLPALVKLHEQEPCIVVLDPASPAGALIPDIEAAGIEIHKVTAREMKQACGGFHRAFTEGDAVHIEQPILTGALGSATKRDLLDAWAWARREPDSDITPLVAATLALWGFAHSAAQPKKQPAKMYAF